jgi:hypothetical protein
MSETTHSGLVPRQPSSLQKRIASAIMTLFAIVFTLMPIVTIGLWVAQFFGTARGTSLLFGLTGN